MRHLIIFLKLALSVSILAPAGGCSHRPMDAVIASWQNQQAAEVVAAWGKPSEELKIEGNTLLLWQTVAGQLVTPVTKNPALVLKSGYCVRLLKADRKGRVFEGTWDGDDCPGWFSGWAR